MQGESRPKKILYMITKGTWGGAQEYVYTLAKATSEKNFTVIVLTGEGNALSERLSEHDITTYSLPTLMRDISLRKELRSFFSLIKIIRAEKPDVLHLNSSKIGIFGSLAGRIARVPHIIFTAHGWPFNEDGGIFRKSVLMIASWITITLSHRTIVIARRELEQGLAFPLIPKHKLVLIHNGIDTIDFLTKTEARKELEKITGIHTPHTTPWIGTIAELHKNKGLTYAIEGLSRVSIPYIYYIIGGGEEQETLERTIRAHKLEHNVVLLGNIHGARKFLKAFDIFLLPSTKEGLPYALLEAGHAGCAVIASKVGGIPEIIENGVSGVLVTRKNKTEITRAVTYAIEHPEERKKMSDHLKSHIARTFSVKDMIEKTLEVYTK